MSVKISLPNQILLDEDGEEVSQHRSPEEAMESASNKSGKYRLVRPDGEIVVSGDVVEAPVEPEEPTSGGGVMPPPVPSDIQLPQFEPTQFISAAKRSEIEGKFNLPPQDADGWSEDPIGPNTKIFYINKEDFDNDRASHYTLGQFTDMRNPPEFGVVAFEDIQKAIESLPREQGQNYAASGDYRFMLKGGQSHSTPYERTNLPSGLSLTDRCVFARYGTGMPVIDDFGRGQIRFWRSSRNISILGIGLYNKFRDPNHDEFVGWGNTDGDIKGGFRGYTPTTETGMENVLIEGCFLNYASLGISGGGLHTDVMMRRNVIINSYSEGSHQQGLYGANISLYLGENVFDHDGWFMKQIDGGNEAAMGQATMFNHSAYLSNCHYLWFYGNCFLRSSSIGNKFTANSKDGIDIIKASNFLIEHNYYLDGEIGISAGGNTDFNLGHRWEHMYILNNFIDRPGESQHTGRTLGWGTDMQDWHNGTHAGNIYRGARNPAVSNAYAWHITGHCTNVFSAGNIAYNIGPKDREVNNFASANLYQGDSLMENVVEWGNQIQQHDSRGKLVRDDVVQGVEHLDNFYFSASNDPDRAFKRNGYWMAFQEWQSHQTAPNYNLKIIYKDPERDERSYMESLGFEGTTESFVEKFTGQRMDNWDDRFTAKSLLAYLREGFEVERLEAA